MKDNLLLSIAIPTYNRAKYLKETLENLVFLINKEGPGLCEIQVSDNCSSDNSVETLNEFSQKYEFVRFQVNHQTIGPEINLLKSLKNSRGRYLWIFSDDDLLTEGSIRAILEIIEKHQPAYIYANYAHYNLDLKTKIKSGRKIKEDLIIVSPDEVIKKLGFNIFFMCSNIIKSDFFKELPDLEPFTGSIFLHLYMILNIIRKGISYCSALERVKQRGGNSGAGGAKFIGSIHQVIEYAKRIGYSKKTTNYLTNEFLLSSFYNGLQIGANGGNKNGCALVYLKLFKKNYLFWVLMMPLFLTPNFVLMGIKKIKDLFFNKRGGFYN